MDRLRIAVWGLGRHALRRILPAIAAVDRLQLHGVCSRDAANVADCAQRWRCEGWTDPSAMLADAGVDVVYVATPIGLHFTHCEQVLDAGKHLWCEKPLATQLTEADALVQTSRSRKRSLCEGFMYLYHAQFRQLREYLSTNRLGTLRSLLCRFGIPPLQHSGFRADPALKGGAFFDVGCYTISILPALFPGVASNVVASRVGSADQASMDTGGYSLIELSNDVTAFLEWRINASYHNEISFWGDHGTLFTDRIFSKERDHVPTFHFRDVNGAELVEHASAEDHFVSMFNAFARTVVNHAAAEAEREQILARAALMDRIWSSSDKVTAGSPTRKVNA